MSTDVVPKFIDDPNTVVEDALTGLSRLTYHCQRIENTNVIVRAEIDPTKVQVVCGGGSGHEPAHAFFVQRGWLSAAVCGSVYASPPTAHVTAAIENLAQRQDERGAGILLVIKNYAGDVLNFEYAARLAREKGIRVETVLAADDAVFGVDDTGKRRGIAGTCLLYKILGGAAERGLNLIQLKTLAERISSNMRSIGAALSSCALPGCPASSAVPAGTVEIGLGIHGEKGLRQVPYTTAKDLVHEMLRTITADPPLPPHPKVLLLVNNLGATTELEMSIVAHHALLYLEEVCKVTVAGVNVGRHMTALDMHGFSLTVLSVANEDDLELMLHTREFQAPLMNFHTPLSTVRQAPGPQTALQLARAAQPEPCTDGALYAALHHLFTKLLDTEAEFNALDAAVGDGDLGNGVHRSAAAALELLPHLPLETDVAASFRLLSKAVADSCAGTSGPLYGALLLAGGRAAGEALAGGGSSAEALRAAVKAAAADVCALGGARRGDRTMADVLIALAESPQVAAAGSAAEVLAAGLAVAQEAAAAVAQMPAKFGRSRYMQGKEIGLPDPGCELIVRWLKLLTQAA